MDLIKERALSGKHREGECVHSKTDAGVEVR